MTELLSRYDRLKVTAASPNAVASEKQTQLEAIGMQAVKFTQAVWIFLCCISVSTIAVFLMSDSDYQYNEPDFFNLANDSIVANSVSPQSLVAIPQRLPKTPRVIRRLYTFRKETKDIRLPSVIDFPQILPRTVIPINPPSQHRSRYRNASNGGRVSPIFPQLHQFPR